MKKIILTLLLFGMAGIMMAQGVDDSTVVKMSSGVPGSPEAPKIRLRCGLTATDLQPLIVVDGVIREGLGFDPNEIESISVLKSPASTAIYGNRGWNGVILVTTRNVWMVVRDSISGMALPFVTIELRRGEKVVIVQSDIEGRLRLNKLIQEGDWHVKVSSTGYRQAGFRLDTSRQNKSIEVYLARDIQTCSEVVVTAYPSTRISCSIRCVMGTHRCDINKEERKADIMHSPISLFPNPAPRGTSFNLAFDGESTGELYVEMADMNGRRVFQQRCQVVKGRNVFSIPARRDLGAGIYFINIMKEGKVKDVARVVIE